MFRAAIRSSPRALRHSSLVAASSPTAGRRLASTAAPADKKYTWKSTAARWGLAAGLLYWFNTSPIFADEAPRTFFSSFFPDSSQERSTFFFWLTAKDPPPPHSKPFPRAAAVLRVRPPHRRRDRRGEAQADRGTTARQGGGARASGPTTTSTTHDERGGGQVAGARRGSRRREPGRVQPRDGRDQLGLPLPGRHGARALRRRVQGCV